MSSRPKQRRAPRWAALIAPAAGLALLLAFNFFFVPGFFDISVRDGRLYGSLIDVLDRGAPVLITSLGMTLVIATAGVDLSVGAVLAVAGALAAVLITQSPLGLGLVLAATLLAAAAAGAWNGLLVAVLGVQPIVATLVLMVAGRGIAQLLTDGQIVTFTHAGLAFLGSGYVLGLPFGVVLAAVLCVAMALLFRVTALRLMVEAIGDNPTASRYAGVPVASVKLLCYTICGLMAGVAGLLVAADIRAADANNAGLYIELDAILAVVVGGTALTGGRFFIAGTVLGAVFIQTLTTTILTYGVPVEYTLIVKAVTVLIVCLAQSRPRFRAAWIGARA